MVVVLAVMDPPDDLTYASRAEVLARLAAREATIVAQHATIARLQERVALLEQRLGSSGGNGMPGTKPADSLFYQEWFADLRRIGTLRAAAP